MWMLFCFSLLLLPAVPPPVSVAPNTSCAATPSHLPWDTLLQRHVSAAGKVDYAGMKKDVAALDAYLRSLQLSPPSDDWSENDRMAYWINIYNAATVRLIVAHYPVKSIMDLDGGKTWDVPRVAAGSRTYSLNQIENDILRPRFRDPRIHFALNCAAKSCPPLSNRAFQGADLDARLDARTRLFINDPAANRLSPHTASLSRIFDWYAADFGNLPAFLNRYAQVGLSPNAKIVFLEYDWSLND